MIVFYTLEYACIGEKLNIWIPYASPTVNGWTLYAGADGLVFEGHSIANVSAKSGMALMKFPLLFFRVGFGLLLLSVVLVILSLFAGKTLPYMGELAYISTHAGVNNLYLMDAEREFNFRLKSDFVNDCCLTWSPDGQRLTFIRDMSSDGSTDIFSMNFHSSAQRLTTAAGADLYPTYSPDGRQIAYMGYGYGNPEIYLMNADGSGQHVLTGHKLLTNLNPHPVWSTDGQSVLFSDFNNLDSLLAVPAN